MAKGATQISYDSLRNHIRALNLLRRQLTKDQRTATFAAMRADGMSYRQIAEVTGVDPMTVHKNLRGVENSTPAAINGRDGKRYPAQRISTPGIQANDAVQIKRRQLDELPSSIFCTCRVQSGVP